MPDTTCSVDGCGNSTDVVGAARGWCPKHYTRWRKHGDPTAIRTLRGCSIEEQFFARVDAGEGHGCWLWTGKMTKGGYGIFTDYSAGRGRGNSVAHRWAYEFIIGPIPEGLTLDHLCVTPPCVNPAHMEPVTQRVNNLRGDTIAAVNAAKIGCPLGHLYDDTNTYWRPTDGGRDCKICINRRSRERNERRRAAKEGRQL